MDAGSSNAHIVEADVCYKQSRFVSVFSSDLSVDAGFYDSSILT
jgi:hypothetical protein